MKCELLYAGDRVVGLLSTMPNKTVGRASDKPDRKWDEMQQVITANRLRDGIVVFVAPENRWVEQLAEAAIFVSVDASAAALRSAQKDELSNAVLDVYAIDVLERGGIVRPAKLREAIRAQGPTVHPEHGKATGQATDG